MEDNSQTKSDKKDVMTIADLVRDGRYFDVYLPEEEYAELWILCNERKLAAKAGEPCEQRDRGADGRVFS